MIITTGLRICQVLFSVVALGLIISLINGRSAGTKVPSQTGFGAFSAGWAVVVALAGCAAIFVEALQGTAALVLDGTAVLISLIGGLVFAATLTAHGCWSDASVGDFYLYKNVIISPTGAATDSDGGTIIDLNADLFSRCYQAKAATAFLWFSFGCFVVTCALNVKRRRGGKHGSVV